MERYIYSILFEVKRVQITLIDGCLKKKKPLKFFTCRCTRSRSRGI